MAEVKSTFQDLYDDFNGHTFSTIAEGEVLATDDAKRIYFPDGTPVATTPLERVKWTQAQLEAFVAVNIAAQLKVGAREPGKVAYLRALAAQHGLVSPAFKAEEFFCKYNDAKVGTLDTSAVNAYIASSSLASWIALGAHFANLVCTVAYMFRVRGHHFLDDLDDRYKSIWNKVCQKPCDVGMPWSEVAVNAFHGIFPIVLDHFWELRVKKNQCAGALAKRFSSPPAGCAVIRSIATGVYDIQGVLPMLLRPFEEQVLRLNELNTAIEKDRWCGSVNAQYYGRTRLIFDEGVFTPLAAIVKSVTESVSDTATLPKAPSLTRVANGAPVTGGVMAKIARKIISTEDAISAVATKVVAASGSKSVPALPAPPASATGPIVVPSGSGRT